MIERRHVAVFEEFEAIFGVLHSGNTNDDQLDSKFALN